MLIETLYLNLISQSVIDHLRVAHKMFTCIVVISASRSIHWHLFLCFVQDTALNSPTATHAAAAANSDATTATSLHTAHQSTVFYDRMSPAARRLL